MLTRKADGFISASRRASISPSVSGPRAAQRNVIAFGKHLVEFAEREDLLDPPPPLPRAAVRGDDAAAESGGAARDLIADPAEPDEPDRAAQDLAVRRPA